MAETTEAEMFMRLMDGLKSAAGSAGQLAHAQQNPSWLSVREMLDAITRNVAVLAASKAMSRQDVRINTEHRLRQLRH